MPSVRRTEDVVFTFEERFIQLIYQTLIMTSLGGQSYLGLCTDLGSDRHQSSCFDFGFQRMAFCL